MALVSNPTLELFAQPNLIFYTPEDLSDFGLLEHITYSTPINITGSKINVFEVLLDI